MQTGSGSLIENEIPRISEPDPGSVQSDPQSAASLLAPHMPGVDLLRGLAITMVVVYHGFFYSFPYMVWHNELAGFLFRSTAAGWTGVNLFFVLSGFLITGNLIDSRCKRNFYSRFYLRRSLRILPVYLGTLFVLALTRQASTNYLLISVIFLQNMPGLILAHGSFLGYAPLWSLAVEEQFYLIWPWLYRTMNDRGLIALCLTLCVICPMLRAAALQRLLWTGDVFSKSWMIADNLAVGALLALLLRRHGLRRQSVVRFGLICLISCGCFLLCLAWWGVPIKNAPLGASVGFSCIEGACLGLLILMLHRYSHRPVERPLRVLIFLSDISYGLYLFHMLFQQLYDGYLHTIRGAPSSLALWTRFFVAEGCAVAIATASKYYFEDPILSLKRRIPSAS